ncbi:MAG TPA: phage recombination protein Bet [Phyllobacterium sp.]|nr:phage recombination protein Bet [Phyllobacterium sp.]
MSNGTALALQPRQMQLIRHTLAKDCNDDEFNLFLEASRSYGLDPFRRQIIPLIFGKKSKDQSNRRMSIVVTRDGLRVVAQRNKNYRPASEPAEYMLDPELVGPLNPAGIVLARVFLWQQDNKGDWFRVAGEAFWEEFAPIADEWVDADNGKRKKSGNKILDDSGNWTRMPRLMIAKCAEMQALRAGWPDQFSGLYAEEEMDRAKIVDLNAAEIVAQAEEDNRLKLAGAANTITLTWGDGWALENVPIGQVADRVTEFLRSVDAAMARKWESTNRDQLRQFWAKAPGDALELKKVIEAAKAKPKQEESDGAAPADNQ